MGLTRPEDKTRRRGKRRHDHIPLEAKFSTFFGPKMPFSENVLGTIRKIYREN